MESAPVTPMEHVRVQSDEQESLILEDYSKALVHFVWHKTSKAERQLIFGLVEAFPKEMDADEFSCYEQCVDFKRNGRFFYIRTSMDMHDALTLYRERLRTNSLTMSWDSEEKRIFGLPSCSFTTWPTFLLANQKKMPFISQRWGMARVHSLFPERQSEDFQKMINLEAIAEWVNSRLCFTLADGEAPLLGSLHLVLPNPLFRKTTQRLIPPAKDRQAGVRITLYPRENISSKDLQSNLQLVHVQNYPPGFLLQTHAMLPGAVFDLPIAGSSPQSSLMIFCRKRGLLDADEPRGFLGQINFEMHIHEGVLTTSVTNGATGAVETRTVQKSIRTHFSVGEKEAEGLDPGRLIIKKQISSEIDKAAEQYGQRYLIDPVEARDYIIYEIIGSARKSLIIVDPYFADLELQSFAMMVPHVNTPVTIITGPEVLRDVSRIKLGKRNSGTDGEEGADSKGKSERDPFVCENIEQMLNDPQKQEMASISIEVMTGKMIFHDRFIIIDDSVVWFSGNSLNNIGNRRSMILKLPDPRPVLNDLAEIRSMKEHVKDFHEWMQNWRLEQHNE